MPNFKHSQYFQQNTSAAFDGTYAPGHLAPYSGVYRCDPCGFEAVSTKNHPLPPATNCQHHATAWNCQPGIVRWRLVAAAIHVSNN
jgi:hypothetical protein